MSDTSINLGAGMFTDVAQSIVEALRTRGAEIQQAQITGLTTGPPRSATINVNGVSVSGVRIMDHVDPTLNEGVWYADMGSGRWLIIGVCGETFNRPQFVRIGGDTMTGALTATTITASTGFSGPGGSITGLDAGQLTTGTVASARLSGSYGGITSVGTLGSLGVTGTVSAGAYNGDGSGLSNLGASSLNFGTVPSARLSGSYTGITSVGTLGSLNVSGQISAGSGSTNGINLQNGGGWFTQDTTWVRTMNGKGVWSAGGWLGTDGGVTIGFSGGTNGSYAVYANNSGYFNGDARVVGQVHASRNGGSSGSGATSNSYTDATIRADPANTWGASTASISFHSSGVAPQLRVGTSDAQIYNRAADGTSNNPFTASAFNVASTLRIKKNISEWPAKSLSASVESALDRIAKLRVVTFDRDEPGALKEVPVGRRSDAYQRLLHYTIRNGLPEYELPDHDCSIHQCDGTADDPCARILNARRSEYGLIAEEVHEVFPEAVNYDAEKKPYSINYSMIDAIMMAGIKELLERVTALEAENKRLTDRLNAAGVA
jgi:hypothetical protein